MNNDPTLNNKSQEYYTAYLVKTAKNSVTRECFKYSKVYDKKYTTANSALPLEYVGVEETIKTTNVRLAYASGDKVELGGRTLSIRSVALIDDPNKATIGLTNSIVAAVIVLDGGGRCA